MLKNDQDILDGCTSNLFNEDDVIDLVRDVRSLTDNTRLKILGRADQLICYQNIFLLSRAILIFRVFS